MLPMFLHFKVHSPKKVPINLYIPLLLVYILLFPFIILGVILLPLLMANKKIRAYLPLIKALPSLLVASNGTNITVQSEEHDIHIHMF